MRPSCQLKRGRNWVMQHDNGATCIIKFTTEWLKKKGIKVLLWPRPIKILWQDLKRAVHKQTRCCSEENKVRLIGKQLARY